MATHTNIEELFDDIRKFVKENPGATVLSADELSNPPKLGWVARIEKDGIENSVNYTININNIKSCNNDLIKKCLNTADGRLALCKSLQN